MLRRTDNDDHGASMIPYPATNSQNFLATSNETMARRDDRTSSKERSSMRMNKKKGTLLALLAAVPTAKAACISLQGSTVCPAFQNASISTDGFVAGRYTFLQFVSNREQFDQQLKTYVRTTYVQEQYQTLLGCSNLDLSNTTEIYARFTTTTVCNAIVQLSIGACSLNAEQARPLCAESCAQFAQSEAYLVADPALCRNPSGNAQTQIRADFTNCALPADALSGANCVPAIRNEAGSCGYGNSTIGLCSYCASGGINSTDSCCYNSNISSRCAGVVLPTVTPTLSLPTNTANPSPTNAAATDGNTGLSGGAIAGIVIGSLVGAALLAGLIFLCILLMRRRRGRSQNGSIFNQPSPARKQEVMAQQAPSSGPPGTYEVLPGGRIARMSALEGHSGGSPSRHGREGGSGATAAAAGAAGYAAGRRRGDDHSSSDGYGESPESENRVAGVLRPPPTTMRRNGSLSSGSVLGAGEDPNSPTSAGGMSSPQGMASQQSEQLPFFKDYYSQDDIHPGERVAVLWAYQPRAADEFSLERGDMLKVVGIWDDGWATGVLTNERAEEWEARRQAQRDSGVSNTSGRGRDPSPPVSGEIKAFPLVCVCMPDHWRKTIEGDGSTETASSAHHTHGS